MAFGRRTRYRDNAYYDTVKRSGIIPLDQMLLCPKYTQDNGNQRVQIIEGMNHVVCYSAGIADPFATQRNSNGNKALMAHVPLYIAPRAGTAKGCRIQGSIAPWDIRSFADDSMTGKKISISVGVAVQVVSAGRAPNTINAFFNANTIADTGKDRVGEYLQKSIRKEKNLIMISQGTIVMNISSESSQIIPFEFDLRTKTQRKVDEGDQLVVSMWYQSPETIPLVVNMNGTTYVRQ